MNMDKKYNDNPFFDKTINDDEKSISNILSMTETVEDDILNTGSGTSNGSMTNTAYKKSLRKGRIRKILKTMISCAIVIIVLAIFAYIIMMIESKNAEYGMEPSTVMTTSSIMDANTR